MRQAAARHAGHAIAQWLSQQQLCDQPTAFGALEPLARLSSRATARRARAARGYLESPESVSNIPLETARDHQDRDLVPRARLEMRDQ